MAWLALLSRLSSVVCRLSSVGEVGYRAGDGGSVIGKVRYTSGLGLMMMHACVRACARVLGSRCVCLAGWLPACLPAARSG